MQQAVIFFFYLPKDCAIFKPYSRLALSHQDFSMKSACHIFSRPSCFGSLAEFISPLPNPGLLSACHSPQCPVLSLAVAGGGRA